MADSRAGVVGDKACSVEDKRVIEIVCNLPLHVKYKEAKVIYT